MQVSAAQLLSLLLVVVACSIGAVNGDEQLRANVLPGRILRAHALEMEVEYLRLYEDMSMKYPKGDHEGKGDGKGGKREPKKCKSGKQKDGKGKDKEHDQGKGKGKGHEKDKGVDDYDVEECVETMSPRPSMVVAPSFAPPVAAPTGNSTNITFAPIPTNLTNVTAPTLAPVAANASEPDVDLSPFFVFYTIEQTRIPTTDDIMSLANFTASYVNTFLGEAFAASNEIVFVSSNVETIGSQFRLGEPVRVDYRATLSFLPTSPQIPPMAELDEILRSVFEGTNAATYIAALQSTLDPANIFATSSAVSYERAPPVSSRGGLAPVGISVMASVAFLCLAVAGVGWYNHRGYSPVGLSKPSQKHMISDERDDHTLDSHSSHTSSKYQFAKSPEPSRSEWVVFSNDASIQSPPIPFEVGCEDDQDEGSEGSTEVVVLEARPLPNITDMLAARRSFLVSERG